MSKRKDNDLYPPIEPYYKGCLDVGDGHKIYYEQCGNPKGVPILFIHGGPGAGCDESSRRFFNPKKWRIILFDQRGAGRSKPYASTYANTTRHLVEDIEKLLKHVGVEKTVVFGGSWGSTLGLIYAIARPERVFGMALRGIWLSEKKECADYLSGQTEFSRFPEICERFLSHVPIEARNNPAEYYYAMMTSGDPKVRRRYAYEWTFYELMRLHLVEPAEEEFKKEIAGFPYVSLAVLEAHYIRNLCFLEDGYILKNARRLPRVPTIIIHGRYDDVCPVSNAFRLQKALPHSKLHIVTAGHASTDPEIRKKLVSEINKLYFKIKK